ncbi:MAG: FtsQ-type POTRA domain-containing protein [Mycobacteriales bacterium]
MARTDSPRTLVAGRETAQRFAQRARAERRRRQRLVLALVGAFCLIAGGVALVARSSLLRVETVEVTGAKRQPAADVVAAAAVPDGAAMWLLDTDAVGRRVAALPRVRSAMVTRAWPRTVRITVSERVPVAVVATAAGDHVVVDSGAAEIERLATAPAGLLAVRLTAPDLPDTAPARGPLISTALAVAVALPPAVRARVELVTVSSTEDVSLQLAGGALVHWGSAELPERKAAVLTALLATPHQLYDVRAPDTPAFR